MAVLWPPELNQFALLASFNDSIPDGRVKGQSEVGATRRRAFWKGMRKITINQNLTSDQWQRLQRFWNEDTQGGVLTFYMVDSETEGQPILLVNQDGSTQELYSDAVNGINILNDSALLCQFGDQPPQLTEAYTGSLYLVQIMIEIFP